MSNIHQRSAPSREKRTGAIAAYSGTVAALWSESSGAGLAQRVRTFAQDQSSDLQRAFSLLRTIRGLGVVVHGPAGCAAALQAGEGFAAPWAVSGIDERDSIMGGDRRLRAAILALAAAHRLSAIAVVTSPVVAINNDDIDSVRLELAEELGIPVIPVLTDGFRTKVAAGGYDTAVHALFKHLPAPAQPASEERVSLLAIAESAEDVAHLRSLLAEAGVTATALPRYGHIDEIGRAGQARLAVSVDPDESNYAGEALRSLYGVDYLELPVPIGVAATGNWLNAVGGAMARGNQADAVDRLHRERLAVERLHLTPPAGARVFVHLPARPAFAVIDLLTDLGLAIAGLGLTTVSASHNQSLQRLAEQAPDLAVLVGEGQAFEEVNLVRRLRPDLIVTRGQAAVHLLRLGIPVLDLQRVPFFGYQGVVRVADAIARRLANPSLARFLGEGEEARYTESWLGKSTHWFIKHEVK
jgi:nitrogenase molybdenum-cofactor synthesis protein NifE